jgi:biotin carboxyl carrier protein
MLCAMKNNARSYLVEVGEMKLRAVADEHGIHVGESPAPASIEDGHRLRSITGERTDGSDLPIYVEESESDHEYIVYLRGEAVRVRLVTSRDERLLALRKNTTAAGAGGQVVGAPMPGLLKAILVEEGTIVEKGESLCILEAMKMENEIKSPARLVVKRLIAKAGTAVEKGAPLVELQPVSGE